jgi:hypothetical protein
MWENQISTHMSAMISWQKVVLSINTQNKIKTIIKNQALPQLKVDRKWLKNNKFNKNLTVKLISRMPHINLMMNKWHKRHILLQTMESTKKTSNHWGYLN